MSTRVAIVLSFAATMIVSLPAVAATKCPMNGQPYSIKGPIKNVDRTKDGQTYYSIYHPHCGSSEDNTIAVYPPSAVAKCAVGVHASASGKYWFRCPEEGDEFGGVCVAGLNDATLACK